MNVWEHTAAVLFLFLGSACRDSPEAEANSARAEERLNLVSNPGVYLRPVSHEMAGESEDGAPPPSDAQLTSLSVANGSHFSVQDLAGDIIWLDADDHRLGSTPFSLRGVIASEALRNFSAADGSLVSGRLHATAATVEIVFTRVKVID